MPGPDSMSDNYLDFEILRIGLVNFAFVSYIVYSARAQDGLQEMDRK